MHGKPLKGYVSVNTEINNFKFGGKNRILGNTEIFKDLKSTYMKSKSDNCP